MLEFTPNIQQQHSTKRGLASTIAQIFDPLGLASPFLLQGKRILQKVTASKISWKDEISGEQKLDWEKWLKELENLKVYKVKRLMSNPDMEIQTNELHVFSDASTDGYGACCYIRQVGKDGEINTSLVFAKSRVAPLKPITTPRMELQAAVVAVRIYHIAAKELKINIDKTYFWCDSRIVLGYIANEARKFHIYVANRVHEIHRYSEPSQWNYVTTKDNPADIASRGASVNELLASNWLTGPQFLQHSIAEYIENNAIEKTLDEGDIEVRKINTLAVNIVPMSFTEKFKKFSSFDTLVKSIVILKQAVKNKWQSCTPTVQII